MAPPQPEATFELFQAELARLVERFDRQFPFFTSPDYVEATLRADFLDPFFRALGWDVGNTKGFIHTEREVDIEVRTAVSGRQTRADYVFRAARVERFTCEAKKPAEVLNDPHIFQAKRDAFARGVPLALLSDFQELKIFVVGARPHRDEPHVGEWKVLHFRQYLAAAREIWDLLAYENVTAGSIDRLIESLPKRPLRLKGRQGYLIRPDRNRSLDADFLNFLDDVRQQLGSDLLKHNDRADLLTGHHLNEAAQHIIDRLVFLRICEDRGIDTGQLLQSLFDGWYRQQQHPPRLHRPGRQTHLRFGTEIEEDPAPYDAGGRTEGSLYREIVEHLRSLDQRPPSYKPFFNGQLFKPHFSEDLTVGDEWLANFILDLTDDDTGYNFATIKVEILGDVYERFLGKVLRPQGRGATIEEKPEVRKAGGVYYTPRYITDYIVEQTVGRLVEGKTPKEVQKLRILDPACGSGSFLLRAYERVMEHYLRWFTADPKRRRKEDCYVDAAGNVRLTTRLKRRILAENIYGVDIDAQAVEVTQLSLYLKMLEGENRETLRAQTELFRGEALLPPLDHNIRCFNSLIASDFSLDPDELVRVNAGDWEVHFPAIMKAGGFDVVIGNPPYVRQESLKDAKSYFERTYEAFSGTADLYVYFMEKGVKLLRRNGRYGIVVSSSFLRATYAQALREALRKHAAILRIVDFGGNAVFADAKDTYVCIPLLGRAEQPESVEISKVTTLAPERIADEMTKTDFTSPISQFSRAVWPLKNDRQLRLFAKLDARGVPLGEYLDGRIFYGIKTGLNEAFLIDAATRAKLIKADRKSAEIIHPARGGEDIRQYFIQRTDSFIIFTRRGIEIDRYPALKAHLEQFRADLTPKKSADDRRGRKPGSYKWYEIQDDVAYYESFEEPKLLFPDICKYPRFCLDSSGIYPTNTAYALGTGDKYLLGVLNSRLFWFAISNISIPFGVRAGELRYRLVYQYIEKMPVRRLDLTKPEGKAAHDMMVDLVNRRLTLTPALRAAKNEAERTALQNAVTKTDRDINQLVYQLYGLTPEEIALVEGTAAAPAREAD